MIIYDKQNGKTILINALILPVDIMRTTVLPNISKTHKFVNRWGFFFSKLFRCVKHIRLMANVNVFGSFQNKHTFCSCV